MESFLPIVQFLLPEFILDNFELTSIDRQDGLFQVHIEEKNADQNDPERKNLLSKGFFPTITVQDFPIRGHQVFLHIKRRRWLNTKTGKVVYRDWTQVADGTRMTSEFSAFLKQISRYQPE
ncbi:MAG: transposase family protein [Spirosoma sp.]|uniref:ISAon1 family transposase N-terminal region protein n=1 Tax=unclassified Spirosoma TaxID=2621999 RepID=UPI00095F1ABE|nr:MULTISPECIES: transposase [unclassified Spirosoma]MBN8825273.1 transposase family protein [Spirosoma sp.]OJW75244.1 MAG: transposase [Spirosoma sp. 48-14]